METVVVAKAAGMGIGGAGVIGATGYGAYTLIKPKNIKEQLEWEGKHPLPTKEDDSSKDSEWKKLVGKYESGSDKFSDLSAFTGITDENEKVKKLKEACKQVLIKSLTGSDAEDLKKAKKWCTEESDQLST